MATSPEPPVQADDAATGTTEPTASHTSSRVRSHATFVLAVIAVLKSGGAYLPLDAEHPQKRLEFMLRDAQAPVV